jgi:transcriptional regulator with XRE-family HTH domain
MAGDTCRGSRRQEAVLVPLRGERAQHEQFAAQLRASGLGRGEIIVELGRRFGLRPRRAARHASGWTLAEVAAHVNVVLAEADLDPDGKAPLTQQRISDFEHWPYGGRRPSLVMLHALARTFGVEVTDLIDERDLDAMPASDRLVLSRMRRERETSRDVVIEPTAPCADDEQIAWELARRAGASEVGDETLAHLEIAVDDFATQYAVTPPGELVERVRHHLVYVSQLLDARKNLDQHRRLLTVGAWLSLLAATMHIDLGQRAAAMAELRTASSLASHAGHREIRAWCLETEAWQALTDGEFRRTLMLSQGARRLAPAGSSVAIQAVAQEARAWARLGDRTAATRAITVVERLVAPRPRPERPEHHYVYDPDKFTAYAATTLAWAGDPAAEIFAREIIAKLRRVETGGRRPRRMASAKLDLAKALILRDAHDEACAQALQAVLSGRLVPSNYWRALEIVRSAEAHGVPEAVELREAYQGLPPAAGPDTRTPSD